LTTLLVNMASYMHNYKFCTMLVQTLVRQNRKKKLLSYGAYISTQYHTKQSIAFHSIFMTFMKAHKKKAM